MIGRKMTLDEAKSHLVRAVMLPDELVPYTMANVNQAVAVVRVHIKRVYRIGVTHPMYFCREPAALLAALVEFEEARDGAT